MRTRKAFFDSTLAATVFFAMLAAGLVAFSPPGRHMEALGYDLFFLLRGPVPPAKDIVIVAIDEPSLAVIREQWPWDRSRHATLIERLFEEGARAVALDILFAEPSGTIGDQRLADAIQAHPGVIPAACLDVIDTEDYRQQAVIFPPVALSPEKRRCGIINLPVEPDGFVRRVQLRFGNIPALSYRAVEVFSDGGTKKEIDAYSRRHAESRINFIGPPRAMPTVSCYQALDPGRFLPRGFFKGKLVFIGLSLQAAPEIADTSSDHFFHPFARWGGTAVSGVEIHATIAENLLSRRLIHPFRPAPVLYVVIWLVGFSALIRLRPKHCAMIVGGLSAAAVGGGYLLFARYSLYLPTMPMVLPVWAGALAAPFPAVLRLRKEKKNIRAIFSRYVSPAVVEKLLEDPSKLKLGGEIVEATVMYLDIADFTALAAATPPETLVGILSRTLGRFSDLIFQWDGMVDKYVGDAIMAAWGVPLPVADHPAAACRCALELIEALRALNEEEKRLTGTDLHIRIGLNSGRMLAGNVGGERFLNYTVHGEATNLAVRLEAVNKLYQTRILLGQATALALGNAFVTREIDRIRLPGQSSPIAIFELMGLSATLPPGIMELRRGFEAARQLFLDRRFDAAREAFSILNRARTDGPTRIFLERCERFKIDPPPAEWDGISEIRVK